MLKIETFTQGFKKMQLSFEFEPNLEYQGMIFDSLKEKINDKMFIDSCNAILEDTSKETWNKAYGFKGRPAVKDWLDAFIPKIVEKSRYKECKITGAILVEHYFDYPDNYLEFLNQQKRGKFKELESESKNNNQAYLNQLKTSIIKKI
jgi:hypothetical protein